MIRDICMRMLRKDLCTIYSPPSCLSLCLPIWKPSQIISYRLLLALVGFISSVPSDLHQFFPPQSPSQILPPSNTMAPRIQASRRGGKPGGDTTVPRRTGAEWEALQAAKAEAERRERILEDRRRTEAKWRPKIPEVRKLISFEAFKNRFHAPDEPDYAVEVLYATAGNTTPNIQAQIRREQTARRKEDLARTRQKWGPGGYGYAGYGGGDGYGFGYGGYGYETASYIPKRSTGDDKVKNDKKLAADASQLRDAHMQRIRIHSQAVLGHLTSLLNESERRSTPRTFIRPFKPLVYFQPKMREILATLEEKWGDVEGLEDIRSEPSIKTPPSEELEIVEPVAKASARAKDEGEASQRGDEEDEEDRESLQSVDSNAEEQELLMDGVEALRDLRCYVDFVDSEVIPLYTQVSLSPSSPREIVWSCLCDAGNFKWLIDGTWLYSTVDHPLRRSALTIFGRSSDLVT